MFESCVIERRGRGAAGRRRRDGGEKSAAGRYGQGAWIHLDHGKPSRAPGRLQTSRFEGGVKEGLARHPGRARVDRYFLTSGHFESASLP